MDDCKKPLVEIEDLKKHFVIKDSKGRKGILKAVDGVSFVIHKGETFGLVGESGCGKSTLGRTMLNLYPVDSGKLVFDGNDVSRLSNKEKKRFCSNSQLVFQDPSACLNPRKRIGDILAEPFIIHYRKSMTKKEMGQQINNLLEVVGLSTEYKKRFPHEMSGGQKQRIGIARALALNPKLVVCDEPVSALDVSIQAQVLNLLNELQAKRELTYLFISHDLSVVYHMCKRSSTIFPRYITAIRLHI